MYRVVRSVWARTDKGSTPPCGGGRPTVLLDAMRDSLTVSLVHEDQPFLTLPLLAHNRQSPGLPIQGPAQRQTGSATDQSNMTGDPGKVAVLPDQWGATILPGVCTLEEFGKDDRVMK